MKIMYNRLALGSAVGLVLGLAVAPAAAQESYSWSGVYIGGGVSTSITNYETNIDYGARTRYYDADDNGPDAGDAGFDAGSSGVEITRFGYVDPEDLEANFGWTEGGQFSGYAYDAIQSLKLSPQAYDTQTNTNSSSGFLLDSSSFASRWVNSVLDDDARAGANLYAGYQHHASSNLVFGVEAQVSFTNYDQDYWYQWNEAGSRNEFQEVYDFDDGLNPTTTSSINIDGMDVDLLSVVSRSRTCLDCDVFSEYEVDLQANFSQSNMLSVNMEIGPVMAPVARFGVAHGRFQLFGFAGAAFSRVKLETSASVAESGTIIVDDDGYSDAGGDVDFDNDNGGTLRYEYAAEWHGSTSEWRTGYRVGAGAEYAATDNLILRLAYDYTDLGSIETTATADRSNTASYTVSNDDLSSHSVIIGAALKF